MNKLVYSPTFGGFSISDDAGRWLLENGVGEPFSATIKEEIGQGNWYGQMFDDHRHHPLLVRCVEELGDAASGVCAKLRIYEIPGTRYRIEEYDGHESVITPDDEFDWVEIPQLIQP